MIVKSVSYDWSRGAWLAYSSFFSNGRTYEAGWLFKKQWQARRWLSAQKPKVVTRTFKRAA